MQFRRSVRMGVLVGVLLLTGVILGVLVWHSQIFLSKGSTGMPYAKNGSLE